LRTFRCDFAVNVRFRRFGDSCVFVSVLQEPAEGRGRGCAEGSGRRELVARMEVSLSGI
jgi:hypothetical protein